MRERPSAIVFALLGAALLVGAVVLAVLGSFAFLAVASIGLFFVGAALIVRASPSPLPRVAAVLAVGGLALSLFGLVATPLFYTGWGFVAGAIAVAVIAIIRTRSGRPAM